MKKLKSIVAILTLALASFSASAQMDEHTPGLYTLIDGEYVPLEYNYHLQGGVGIGLGSTSISVQKYKYDGATSGVTASDTFVLVVDPKKKSGMITSKKYTFLRHMTPEDMLILPFTQNKKKDRREYDPGLKLSIGVGIGSLAGGLKDEKHAGFEWERLTDNSFKIKISDLTPGEYGIILRQSRLGTYEYTAMFGFTVPERAPEEQLATPAADTTTTTTATATEIK